MNPMYMVVGILIVWVIAFAVFMTLLWRHFEN